MQSSRGEARQLPAVLGLEPIAVAVPYEASRFTQEDRDRIERCASEFCSPERRERISDRGTRTDKQLLEFGPALDISSYCGVASPDAAIGRLSRG
jgi:hypothetical protein